MAVGADRRCKARRQRGRDAGCLCFPERGASLGTGRGAELRPPALRPRSPLGPAAAELPGSNEISGMGSEGLVVAEGGDLSRRAAVGKAELSIRRQCLGTALVALRVLVGPRAS